MLPIDSAVDRALDLTIALGWGDLGLFAVGTDDVDDGLGVVAAIGDQGLGRRKSADQGLDRYLVGGLPGRQNDRLPCSYAPCLGSQRDNLSNMAALASNLARGASYRPMFFR